MRVVFRQKAPATLRMRFAPAVSTARSVAFTPAGDLAATNVQDALGELDNEKQPRDQTLTALANLVTAANQMIYATGADAFAMTGLTAFARTLLDADDATAARNTIGAPSSADTSAALSNRLRFDAAQALSDAQKAQAQSNIGLVRSGGNGVNLSALVLTECVLLGTAPTNGPAGYAADFNQVHVVRIGDVVSQTLCSHSSPRRFVRSAYNVGGGAVWSAWVEQQSRGEVVDWLAGKFDKVGGDIAGPVRSTASSGRQISANLWADLASGADGSLLLGNNLAQNYDAFSYFTPSTHASLGYVGVRMYFGALQVARFNGATVAGQAVSPTWHTVWDANNFRRPDTGPWQSLNSASGAGVVLPAGGTWAYALNYVETGNGAYNSSLAGTAAGGATVGGSAGFRLWGFGWRFA